MRHGIAYFIESAPGRKLHNARGVGRSRRFGLRLGLFILLAVAGALAQAEIQDVMLEQGPLKVGLSAKWGGGISTITLGGRNYIDDNDCGRLVQCAWFSQTDKYFNPTQGGSQHNNPGGVLELKRLSPTQAYSKARLMQWSAPTVPPPLSTIELEQWTTLRDGYIELRYRWTNVGPRVQGCINQETPVVYMRPHPLEGPLSFNQVHAYCGGQPWTGDEAGLVEFDVTKREQDPNYKKDGFNFRTMEWWIAMTDESGDGVLLLDPEFCDAHARRSYGKAPKFKMLKPYEMWGQGDVLGRNVRENTAYIFIGDWRKSRERAARLFLNRRAWDFQNGEFQSDPAAEVNKAGYPAQTVNFAAASHAGVTFSYRTPHKEDMLTVAFKHDGDREFAPARTGKVKLIGDDQWHEYTLDLSANPQWIGNIRALSFEPQHAPAKGAGLGKVKVDERATVRWDFNAAEETETWFPIRDGDMLTPQSDGRALVVKAEAPGALHYIPPYLLDAPAGDGTRPRMTCWPGLNIKAATHPHFRMRIRRENATGPVQLHWQTTESHGLDRNYINSPHATIEYPPTGDEAEYVVLEADLSKEAAWTGHIEQLMLAPGTGPASRYWIDWIEFSE